MPTDITSISQIRAAVEARLEALGFKACNTISLGVLPTGSSTWVQVLIPQGSHYNPQRVKAGQSYLMVIGYQVLILYPVKLGTQTDSQYSTVEDAIQNVITRLLSHKEDAYLRLEHSTELSTWNYTNLTDKHILATIDFTCKIQIQIPASVT